MAQRVIISVTNDLSSDQRVHRVAETLVDRGYQVRLVGRQKPDSLPLAKRRYATHRMKLVFTRGKWFYLEYAFRLFWWLLFRKTDLLLANDLDTLLPNFLVAKLRGKRLVYDSHEYFTEVPELVDRPRTRAIWLRLEKWLFPRVNAAITVNTSLARIYQEKYGLPVLSLRNLPLRGPIPAPKTPPHRTLIYQGALNLGRGIELMIKAMHHLPDYTLVIVGTGDLDTELRRLATDLAVEDRVQFEGFVPFEELKAITVRAHLGLSLEEDRGASYHYALPNKLFDYLQAGLPVLVADLPEMRRIVETYQVGAVLPAPARTAANLAQQIRTLCEDEAYYARFQQAAIAAAAILNWEHECTQLDGLFPPAYHQPD